MMSNIPVVHLDEDCIVRGGWDDLVKALHTTEAVGAEALLLDTYYENVYHVAIKVDGTIYMLGQGELVE
jgi:hypothetical protein